MKRLRAFALLTCAVVGVSGLHADKPAKSPEIRRDVLGDALPARAIARLGTCRWRLEKPLAFTQDDKTLITLKDDVIRFREIPSGKELKQFKVAGTIREHVVGKDGKRLAVMNRKMKLRMFDLETAKELFAIDNVEDAEPVQMGGLGVAPAGIGLAISADGKFLAYQNPVQGKVRIFDGTKGTEVQALTEQEEEERNDCPVRLAVPSIALAPDGSFFGHVSPSLEILLVDAKSRKEIARFESPTKEGYHPVGLQILSRNEIVCRDIDGIHILDVKSGKRKQSFADESMQSGTIAVSNDGSKVAWRDDTGQMLLCWKGKKHPSRLGRTVSAHSFLAMTESVSGLVFSPSGKLIASGGKPFRIWDIGTGKDLLAPLGHQESVLACVLDKTGDKAVTLGKDHAVRSWHDGKQVASFDLAPSASRVALGPHGDVLAFGTEDGKVEVWDIASARKAHAFKLKEAPIDGVSFSADGSRLAAIQGHGVRVWDIATKKETGRLNLREAHADKIAKVNPFDFFDTRISADSPIQLGSNGTSIFWHAISELQIVDIASKKVRAAFPHDPPPKEVSDAFQARAYYLNAPRVLAMSADGRTVCRQQGLYPVNVLEVHSRESRLRVKLPASLVGGPKADEPGSLSALALSPDQRTLVLANQKGMISLWDLDTRRECAHFKGHDGPITHLSFTPDGRRLASCSADTTVLIWDWNAFVRKPAKP